MELIDISLPVEPGMLAWPTGRPAAEHRIVDAGDGTSPRNSEWRLDSHAGTHVDAPLHWAPRSSSADALPLAACFGPCTVHLIEADGPIEAAALPAETLQPGHRLLLRTPNSESRIGRREFDAGFAALAPSAADAIAAAGLALVGIDYLSVETPAGGGAVHRRLLDAGVVLLEGLDLRRAEPGEYGLSALPVRWVGGEAAPTRAVLWR